MPDASDYSIDEFDPLGELELDPENPRLPRRYRGSSQDALLELMIRLFDVTSLAEAIVTAGYLDFDPIAGFRTDTGAVRIREGNRRVAAAKMLLDPDLAPERYRRTWQELGERLPDNTRDRLRRMSVQVWQDPESIKLTAYIGYRHVTGVRPWPPIEKARFIAYLIESEQLSYKETADRIGSKPRHVERHYLAYRVVEQAFREDVAGTQQMEDSFGVLLRSLQAKGIPEFLGIEYTGSPSGAQEPIPPERDWNFRDFVRWTFGTDETPKVLRDSRDVTRWARILASDKALAYLRRSSEPDFERAWERSGGEAESLAESLLIAADNLREAVPIIADHANDADVLAAASECARFFARMIRPLPEIASEAGLSIAHD